MGNGPWHFQRATFRANTNANLTLGLILHGTPEPSSISMGLAAPDIRDRPLHPATAGHVLVFHHPLSRSAGRSGIYPRRGDTRRWTAPPILQGISPSEADSRTRNHGARQSVGRELRG